MAFAYIGKVKAEINCTALLFDEKPPRLDSSQQVMLHQLLLNTAQISYFTQGKIFFALQKNDQAIANFKKVIAGKDSTIDIENKELAHYYLARLYHIKRDPKNVIIHFMEALAINQQLSSVDQKQLGLSKDDRTALIEVTKKYIPAEFYSVFNNYFLSNDFSQLKKGTDELIAKLYPLTRHEKRAAERMAQLEPGQKDLLRELKPAERENVLHKLQQKKIKQQSATATIGAPAATPVTSAAVPVPPAPTVDLKAQTVANTTFGIFAPVLTDIVPTQTSETSDPNSLSSTITSMVIRRLGIAGGLA
jgi:tetratricopeptide (TPR) repeat protein